MKGIWIVKSVLTAVFLVTALVLSWLCLVTYRSYTRARTSSAREIRIVKLSGTIRQLDEVLTMSARMAAATGDFAWEKRYRKFDPELDAAIKDLLDMSSGPTLRDFLMKTDAANRTLVGMEGAAFRLAHQGLFKQALRLLSSKEYLKQKENYSQALEEFLAASARLDEGEWLRRKFERMLMLGGLLCVLLVLVGACFAARGLLEKARRAEEDMSRYFELEQSAAALLASELRYRRLFEAAQDGILILDAETGDIVDVNPFLTKLLELSRENLLGKKVWEIGTFKDVIASKKRFTELQNVGYARYDNLPLQTVAGRKVQVEFVSNVYMVDQRKVIQCNIRDITARKKAEVELRESEARYRVLFESNADGILIADAETRKFKYANPAVCRMFGYSEKELQALGVESIHPNEPLPSVIAEFKAMASGAKPLASDIPCLRKDGTVFYADISGVKLVVNGRQCTAGQFRDITQRKLANEDLHRLASIIESADDCVAAVSLDGAIQSWNAGAQRMFGYTAKEIIGKKTSTLCPPNLRADQARLIASVRNGTNIQQYETIRVGKNGKPIDVSVSLSQIKDAQGMLTGYSAIVRDITKNRQLEAELRQSQKMESVGRLAGGVAHDFNNILTAINGFTGFAMAGLAEGDQRRDDLKQVLAAGERATRLTRQLLAFSRKQILNPQVLDINAAAGGVVNMLKRLIGEDVKFETQLAAQSCLVKVDAAQIEQVFLNLAINARDAMPKGGTITLETKILSPDEAFISKHPDLPLGPLVCLSVRDTGCGMTEEVKSHLFEPFFTTKEKGNGTGLGLSMVYGIVKQSGGDIEVESALNRGTTFRIYFPQQEIMIQNQDKDKDKDVVPRGNETILFVEDEEVIRGLGKRALTAMGYIVLSAADGREALEVLERHGRPVDLLITDVVMPGMSGRELARKIAQKSLARRTLFVSGYTDDAIVRHGVLEPGLAFLYKPFTPDSLLHKLREVLDGPADQAKA